MVQIRPFYGLRYADAPLEAVTAPPYDVISPNQQNELYEKHPQNIVRLILGKQSDSDTVDNNVYTRAAETLTSWRKNNQMMKENSPAIYAYSQSWQDPATNQKITRFGFLSLVRLAPYEKNIVLPHEYTLSGPKKDRLNLTRATQTTLSPIFLLYNDPELWVENNIFKSSEFQQALTVIDPDGVEHAFLPITDTAIIDAITQLMTPQQVIIADGHHRYETALAYQQEKRGDASTSDGSLPCDYTLAFFTNTASPGLKVYPTHRILKKMPEHITTEDLVAKLDTVFMPSTHPEMTLFWLQVGKKGEKRPMQLRPDADISMLPQPLKELDVAIIDKLVFDNILKTDANTLKQNGLLTFVRDDAEVEELITHGNDELPIVFFVHAPDTRQIENICKSGYRMPQKSTYFYPKLLSGLVLYSHVDN